jgi:transposase InsO family protein
MEERLKFLLDWERGEVSVSELCRQYEVSRKTGYKWLHRRRSEGVAGLADRSRAPLRHPQAMGAAVEAAVLEVRRRYPSWGAKKIRAHLERHYPALRRPAASSIGDLLRREGLTVPRRRRFRASPRTAPFAGCDAANAVWCIDFKGWFRLGDGTRCTPLTLADAYSRYLLRCQALVGSDGGHVWPVLEAAFREYGLPEVMRSDNGPPFASIAAGGLSPLAVRLVKAGVAPERIDPGQPQQNGRLERLHLTLKQETAMPPAASLRAQARHFREFRRIYNDIRPHEALGQTPPAEHYSASPRRYSGRLRSPDYPDHWQVRRVRHAGEIKWRGKLVYISATLSGEPVGIEEGEDGHFTVRFGPVTLGTIAPNSTLERPKRKRRRAKPVRG